MRLKLAIFAATLGLLLLGSNQATAQTGTLSGTITDAETGMPVAAAGIEVLGSGTPLTLTNDAGRFTLSAPAGTYAVVISSLGYRDHREDGISVRAGSTRTLDVTMTSQALELNAIVVSASRQAEKNTEAPATTHVVSETEIEERPAVTIVDHMKAIPGVDVISHGTQSTNVVTRGFNNIFSGALHALTDNRLAGVPSLRVNLLHFVPTTSDDLERIEVVLGPGSALYGPQTANGVLHMMTKSPLTSEGTTVTLGSGPRKEVFQGSFRTAHKLSDNFAFKISGQAVAGNEWVFVDPAEQAERAAAYGNPTAFVAERLTRGLTQAEADQALINIGNRDYDFERQSVDARADWAFTDEGRLSFNYGLTNATGIELTGLGAGQVQGWKYQYFQTRLNKDRLFAQVYLNTSDAGTNSFLLRDGAPLVDESRLFVSQIQHGTDLADGKFDFTYGIDYFKTDPRTRGTISGQNEDIDNISEWGAYVQSKIELAEKVDLILAGRIDTHSELEDNIFSPRAAIVFEPKENHSLRFTFNRAFSTPSTLNLFLDISGGSAGALGPLGYRVRAQGPNAGFVFTNPDGSLVGMRSPFNPGGPGQMLPADAATLWSLGVGVLAAQGAIDAATAGLLNSLTPGANGAIGLNYLDASTGVVAPLTNGAVSNIGRLKESTTSTFEVGYQALINDKILVAADAWYSKKENFVSPLVVTTPLLLLDGASMVGFLVPPLTQAIIAQSGGLLDEATAQGLAVAQATQLADGGDGVGGVPGLAENPLGVVSATNVNSAAANLLFTYVNAGDLTMYGADFAVKAFLNDQWTLAATGSWVSDNYFDLTEIDNGIAPIALNAPALKGSLSLAYRNARSGINAEVRARANAEFPAESAGFTGTICETGPRSDILFSEDCVSGYTLVDLTAGYKIPTTRATLQVTVSNIFNEPYRSFVGVPEIGRFLMAQVKYDLF